MAVLNCSVEGCDRSSYARTYCRLHYKRWRNHGDALWQPPTKYEGNCDVDGCDRLAVRRRFCRRHYNSWRAYGDAKQVDENHPQYDKSTAEGCIQSPRTKGSKYCERHYYQIRRNGRLGTKSPVIILDRCLYCDEAVPPTNPGRIPGASRMFCSERCSTRHSRNNPRIRSCTECGKEYAPINKGIDRKVCSDKCAHTRDRRIANAWLTNKRHTDPAFRDKGRAREYKRKAARMAVDAEDFSREEIFERDGWRCGLCGKKVSKTAKWPGPSFAVLDHITPLIHGGTHTRANVQCAHNRCNSRKGSKMIGQLRLIG